MTTPTPDPGSAAPHAAAARLKLHPMSWLFMLLQQLRSFALPIVVLLFSGRGEQNPFELFGLAGAGLLALWSVWQYFTYRYGFLERALVIRSGVLQRNLRLIPFDRVQNVILHQNPLHRLFGVAEVRLESSGGFGQAEAEMRVLTLAQAHALEQLVQSEGRVGEPADAPESAVEHAAGTGERATLWLALPTSELVRLGLISNRGMLAVAAGFAYLSQAGKGVMNWVSDGVERGLRGGVSVAETWHLGPVAYAVGGALLLLGFLVAVRMLSVVLAIVQFHGFRLYAGERELRVERGLLSRLRAHLPKRRIQSYSLRETLLHRWFHRQSLRVDRAAMESGNTSQSIRDLVPLATPEGMEGILQSLLPGAAWPPVQWHALHPRAWWRKFSPWALLLVAATIGWTAYAGMQGLWLLAGLPLAWWRARLWARYSAWSLDDGVVAFRQGWLNRHWRFAEARKLHGVTVTQGPIDRHHGMATLWMDTIGASPMEPPLRIPFMPIDEALALAQALRRQLPTDAGGALSRARTAASAAPAA